MNLHLFRCIRGCLLGRRFFESDEFAHIAWTVHFATLGIFTYERPLTFSDHHLTVLQPEELCRERTENPVRPWRTTEIFLIFWFSFPVQAVSRQQTSGAANSGLSLPYFPIDMTQSPKIALKSSEWMMSGCMLSAWDRLVTLCFYVRESRPLFGHGKKPIRPF